MEEINSADTDTNRGRVMSVEGAHKGRLQILIRGGINESLIKKTCTLEGIMLQPS